ncbi:hypothetical protein [Salinigranum salinum]|uniref:hypothetical protein n=1 Tax=Salinigranum salinum TaxID=1364937 RepID=UPI0012612D9C|nr:hypothetical protein [Salinigranum salinum]
MRLASPLVRVDAADADVAAVVDAADAVGVAGIAAVVDAADAVGVAGVAAVASAAETVGGRT